MKKFQLKFILLFSMLLPFSIVFPPNAKCDDDGKATIILNAPNHPSKNQKLEDFKKKLSDLLNQLNDLIQSSGLGNGSGSG